MEDDVAMKLCTFRDQAVAGLVESLLREQGFHPRPINISGHVFVAGAGQWYDLWVSRDEATRATELLKEEGFQSHLCEQ